MPDIIPITDRKDPALIPYAHLNENQLRHYYEPGGGLFIAESPNVILRALDAGLSPESLLIETRYLDTEAAPIIARCPDVPVYTADISVLSDITGYHLTRGILCAMHRPVLPSVQDILQSSTRVAVLDNIENPTNVGAIFRSAAALGMDAVLLTGNCSDPLYRRAVRVSVGTVFQIPWTYLETEAGCVDATGNGVPSQAEGIRFLQKCGFKTAAMALRNDTVSIRDPALQREPRLAVVLGNEGEGLSPETIDACDMTIRIPMAHGVDSLNVAAASALAFWELGHKLV